MILLTKWFGCFLLDDSGDVIDKRLFPEDALPGYLQRIMNGEILDEERELADGSETGPAGGSEADLAGASSSSGKIMVVEKRLAEMVNCELTDFPASGKGTGVDIPKQIDGKIQEKVDVNFLERAEKSLTPERFGCDPAMLKSIMTDLMAARETAGMEACERDGIISAAFHTLEDMRQNANLMNERLMEWHEVFSTKTLGRKKAAELPGILIDFAHEENREDAMERLRTKFGWAGACGLDMDLVSTLAYNVKTSTICSNAVEKYIDAEMGRYAPNVSAVAGTQVGAALIAVAGSLKRLAMFPAGTVQLLGAEKAFFRYKKEGGKPPKHGYIYRIPTIRLAPKKVRGRLSRHYAGKIAIAARMDYFGETKAKNPEFLEKFERKRKEIASGDGKK